MSKFPGIKVAPDRSDPILEVVTSDDDADSSFSAVALAVQEGTALRRSDRITRVLVGDM